MTEIQQIAEYLEDQGIGVVGTSIFYSYLPDTQVGTFTIAVLDSVGGTPDVDIPTKSPGFQVFVRANTYDIGKAKVDAIRAALHQKRNSELVADETYFYYILLQAEPGHLGRNANGKDEFSMNFYTKTR